MKPELTKHWDQAMSLMAKAEDLWAVGQLRDAGEHATMALLSAYSAVRDLAKELNLAGLSAIASSLFSEVCEKRDSHRTPQELMDWARATLKRVHSQLPPDTFPPPRL